MLRLVMINVYIKFEVPVFSHQFKVKDLTLADSVTPKFMLMMQAL